MPNETVLIVDADAASLKLIAFVLRREGYQIQVSSSGEQALTTLQSDRVDLMLVNTVLPGMSSSELARHVKEDVRTAHVILVGLRDPKIAEADQGALTGFAGCLAKPLNPVQLARSVRALLDAPIDSQPLPAQPLSDGGSDDFRRRFAEDGFRESRNLLNSLGSSFDSLRASQTTQDLAAMAQTLGFADITERAHAATDALRFYPGQWTKLQGPLANLMSAFERAANGGQQRMPAETAHGLRGSQIALIGFPNGEADRMCDALAKAGARVRLFDASESMESEAVRGCGLYMVYVRPETVFTPWLRNTLAPLSQTILVGRIENLLALDSAVQLGVREFLVDGWRPEELVLRLVRTLSAGTATQDPEEAPAPAPVAVRRKAGEVLIVDDDPNVRALVKAILENQGITCRIAASGEEGVGLAKQYAPAAALLDVNMPGMSGFEALPKIRAASPTTKVVMLTGREQEADIVQGFSLGTDDYVVKPFIPSELVARLRRLL